MGYTMTGFGGTQGDLLRQFNEQYEAARRANLSRYAELKTGYRQRELDVMDQINRIGATGYERINRAEQQGIGNAQADAINRGMFSSSYLGNVERGVRSDAEFQRQAYDEQLAGLRGGYLANLRGDALSQIERRTDEYPDVGMLLNLMGLAGSANRGPGNMKGTIYTGRAMPTPLQASVQSSFRGYSPTFGRTNFRSGYL